MYFKRFQIMTALRMSTRVFIGLFVGFLIAYLTLPDTLKALIRLSDVCATIVLFSIFYGIKQLRTFTSNRKKIEAIESAKSDSHPLATLKQFVLYCEVQRDIRLKKLDILKSLSPIPVVIYGLGVYLESKKLIEEDISFAYFYISVKELALYFGLFALLIYVYHFVTAYNDYKQFCEDYIRYKVEEIHYEEILLSTEKIRRLPND